MTARVQEHVFSPTSKEQYYYYTEGVRSNPALCIVPGFTGLHDDLLPLARSLREDYFVILPELPGWGRSTPLHESMTIGHYAAYLKTLLEYLGMKQVILVGHCMGSVVVLSFCLEFPSLVSQAFVISVPYQEGTISHSIFKEFVHMSHYTPKRFRWVWYLWRNRLFTTVTGFISLRSRSMHKKLQRVAKGIVLQSKANEQSVEENWSSLMEFAFSSVSAIRVPMHIIHGAKDLIIPLSQGEKFHALLPKASFDVIEYAGHLPPVEAVGGLATLIKKYL